MSSYSIFPKDTTAGVCFRCGCDAPNYVMPRGTYVCSACKKAEMDKIKEKIKLKDKRREL